MFDSDGTSRKITAGNRHKSVAWPVFSFKSFAIDVNTGQTAMDTDPSGRGSAVAPSDLEPTAATSTCQSPENVTINSGVNPSSMTGAAINPEELSELGPDSDRTAISTGHESKQTAGGGSSVLSLYRYDLPLFALCIACIEGLIKGMHHVDKEITWYTYPNASESILKHLMESTGCVF